jgi:undecaprenyl diphosphate synthase
MFVQSLELKEKNKPPCHIAIIMDGNGRWAIKRGLSRHAGHEQGSKTALEILRYAGELGIRHITLYAFSNENWQRPREDIDSVMSILEHYLKSDINELTKNDIRLNAIGDLERLPVYLKRPLKNALLKTANCKKHVITLALSYGAWQEIVYVCKNILKSYNSNSLDINDINELLIRNNLYTSNLPDPELIIRTGGEIRLSNFLLLQASYSELYFCKTLWPDFQKKDFDRALKSYFSRQRRFGTILSD